MLRTSYYSLLHEIIFCPVNIFFLSKYLRTLDGNFTSVAHLKIKKKQAKNCFIVGIISYMVRVST